MLLSIIIPVYNAEEYIGKNIESVQKQAFSDMELILVNDGSTDSSPEICSSYALNDSRIRIFSQRNKGVSAARNLGLDKASGDYIMFIDADDYLEDRLLEHIVPALDSDTILIFNKVFYHNGNLSQNKLYKKNDFSRTGKDIQLFQLDLLTRYFDSEMNNVQFLSCGVTAKIFPKENLIGIKFDECCKYGEDVLFNLEVYENSKKIRYMDYDGYIFNIHNGSSTRKYRVDWVIIQEVFLYRLKNFISAYHKEDYRFQRSFLYSVFSRIPNYLQCFYFNPSNQMTFKESYLEFKKKINSTIYSEAIKTISFDMLNLRQKVFLVAIRFKLIKPICYIYYLTRRKQYAKTN